MHHKRIAIETVRGAKIGKEEAWKRRGNETSQQKKRGRAQEGQEEEVNAI